ncbi:MAG: hypothetical protein QM627_04780 [Luteolibacter sp.]
MVSPQDSSLPIRCPSCHQRFQVSPDLMGKVLQCGGCENQFLLEEQVIDRVRKIYPGEKQNPSLSSFQRISRTEAGASSSKKPASWRLGGHSDPAWIEPMSPQRVLAGLIGGGIIAIAALLLIFGSGDGNMLDGMTTEKRLMFAVFCGVLGVVLIVYANPKARVKSFIIAALFGAGLVSLPLVFDQGSKPLGSSDQAMQASARAKLEREKEQAREQSLREEIGLAPLEKEKNRLESMGVQKRVMGVRLLGMHVRNKLIVRDYLLRVSGADSLNSGVYSRNDDNYLLVLSAPDFSMDELISHLENIGSIGAVHPNLGVVEVKVDNERFLEGPQEKLTDRDNPAFYELNKRELYSVDFGRIQRAVKRLSTAEPKVYRPDISRRMNQLLEDPAVSFLEDLSRALDVWADSVPETAEAAARVLERLHREHKSIPVELVRLISKGKIVRVLPILHELWKRDPVNWEAAYQEMGESIEPALLADYSSLNVRAQVSATRMLGEIGTAASLPVLQEERSKANREIQLMIDQVSQKIRNR